jgi:small subunit ribosomal protein S8
VLLICVESVSEKKQMLENYQGLENQVGNKQNLIFNLNVMIIDPIADLLTRIRNAYMARKRETSAPYSTIKANILKVLKKNKYIADFEVIEGENNKKTLNISLNDVRVTKYIPTLKRISKPGQRIYIKSSDIKKSRNGK